MNFRTNLLLAAVLLALAGFVYFYEIKGGEQRQKSEETDKRLLALEADSVTAFTLLPAGTAFRKEAGKWQITQPLQYPAEESSVKNLLNQLASAHREREIAQGAEDFSAYGLAPARAQVAFVHGGKRDTVALGDKNTTASFVYARINSKPEVVLTGVTLWNSADKELEAWRDKTLLRFETGEVQALTLARTNARFELHKSEGKWQLDFPLQTEADESKVTQILSQLRNSRVQQFVAETMADAKRYGLDRPAFEISMVLDKHEQRKSLQIGNKEGASFYAHDPARPQVFLVDSTLINALRVEVRDLRDKRLANFESFRADYVELQYPDTTIICEKDTVGQWHIAAPQNKKAKSWKVSNLTSTLGGLQAAAFVEPQAGDLAQYGLDNPRAKITVKEKGAELAQVLIGSVHGELVYAKAAGKATVVLIKKADTERLLVKLSELIE